MASVNINHKLINTLINKTVETLYIYLQAWLDKMKMIELQNIVTANDAELNEDEDTLNLKVNSKLNFSHCKTTVKTLILC